MRNKVLSLMALLCVLFCIVSTSACKSEDTPTEPVVKEEYTFTYKLNYEGAGADKVVKVKHGRRANNWKASRAGYTLEGWYLDETCTNIYDFTNYVTSDTTVYANWTKNAEKFDVTFYYNYEGNTDSFVIPTVEGELVKTNDIPVSPRLGYEYDGWYLDAECTEEWDFENDVVTGTTSLYAKYKRDSSLPLNADGTIKYENVVVNVFLGADMGTKTYVDQVVNTFNQLYNGKIQVVVHTSLEEQGNFSLRIQQTQGMNSTFINYYSASQVYDLAGLTLNANDYYAEASRTNIINGTMYSVPLAAGVPCVIYNKELMTKYNTLGHIPTQYSEFLQVMQAAYAGEIASNSEFKSIVTTGNWTFKEAASYAAFIQNDADLYTYENGKYANTWGTDATNAKLALNNFYELFSVNGAAHGAGDITGSSTDVVVNGNALFGLTHIPSAYDNVYNNYKSGKIGILPLSGLFADSDKTNNQQVPVHQISMAFYKASNVSSVQLAAAAVFADYLSQNSVAYGKAGWYPLNKTVVESAEFKNLSTNAGKMLQLVGNPVNFRTLDGHAQEKNIFNITLAEGILMEVYNCSDKENLSLYVSNLQASINALLG